MEKTDYRRGVCDAPNLSKLMDGCVGFKRRNSNMFMCQHYVDGDCKREPFIRWEVSDTPPDGEYLLPVYLTTLSKGERIIRLKNQMTVALRYDHCLYEVVGQEEEQDVT